jgi:hypothetical protein
VVVHCLSDIDKEEGKEVGKEEGQGRKEERVIKLRDTGDDNEMIAVREEEGKKEKQDEQQG